MMKTIIRSYQKLCSHCNGKGTVFSGSTANEICPVCKGMGTITVNETVIEPDDTPVYPVTPFVPYSPYPRFPWDGTWIVTCNSEWGTNDAVSADLKYTHCN